MTTHCVVFKEFTVIFQVDIFIFLERSLLPNVDVFATLTIRHTLNIITFLCQYGNK